MKLKHLKILSEFRGLEAGFEISFLSPTAQPDYDEPISFGVRPICFVGLNGSGKSNVMQLLAEIFYYLETQATSINKLNAESGFGFTLHYQMPLTPDVFLNEKQLNLKKSEAERLREKMRPVRDVIVVKEPLRPVYFKIYYEDYDEMAEVTSQSEFSKLIPQRIIGYTSGMNELLSNPFIRMDFFYHEQLIEERRLEILSEQDGDNELVYNSPLGEKLPIRNMNRMFFLDYTSSALIFLSNFLMNGAKNEVSTNESDSELRVIKEIIDVDELMSFRFLLNLRIQKSVPIKVLDDLVRQALEDKTKLNELFDELDLPKDVRTIITSLRDCATVVNDIKINNITVRLELDYWVDDNLRSAFLSKFRGGALGLFSGLYTLNLYNIQNYSRELVQIVLDSNYNRNLSDTLPKISPEEKVFSVDSVRLKKQGKKIYYKQLSDGEHQMLHIAGALMLMEETGTLFLLDEPETHFNPEWRAQFVSTLNKIAELKRRQKSSQLPPLQEIVLTTHSPFVLSDCMPENIYIFQRDPNNDKVKYRQPLLNTYGTSINILMAEVFGKKETIADLSKEEIEILRRRPIRTKGDIDEVRREVEKLGESVEKFMLIYELNQKEREFE